MMRLRDRIDIVERGATDVVVAANVPAYVGSATAALTTNGAPGIYFETGLHAIIRPREFIPSAHAIRWQGAIYYPDGPPMVRMRGNRNHHLTIPLKRTTA